MKEEYTNVPTFYSAQKVITGNSNFRKRENLLDSFVNVIGTRGSV